MGDLLSEARSLDDSDQLSCFRDEFVPIEPDLIYLDGNSLGRLPKRSIEIANDVIARQWGVQLIESWKTWIDLSTTLGDRLSQSVLGAKKGEVVVCDSTTINLYKIALSIIKEQRGDKEARKKIVIEADNFPTDRYIVDSLAQEFGLEVITLPVDDSLTISIDLFEEAFDEDVIFGCFSALSYKSGARIDMAAVNSIAQGVGSRVIWDLSHAGGAVVVDLEGTESQYAIGCTYKYLNAGPGAPAYLYVRSDLIEAMENPIKGWFSQDDQFEMAEKYSPKSGISRFCTGTPNIIGSYLVGAGIDLIAEATIEALEAKGHALGDFFIKGFEVELKDLGFSLASPKDQSLRGSHVSLSHPRARQITSELIDHGVVPDFRTPSLIRFGFAPLYQSFIEISRAIQVIREVTIGMR
ncbi:aminotransferase class V-fold PLP-dependent enzyme [Acidithrix sp. C25]|uniref:kynureninase n=1 Tax=Acidithrix sp. C25 TaxID=1671482 RepID=UPI00191B99E0|nr:aminotransferase class V-fold PLP-dependent enzyme [Acidithrix sp. C25]CAG4932346.1 unnamed protein product [Acidithrix sp. C25]